MTVTVVTDSAAALPADLVVRHGIRVVPLWLHVGDEHRRDGEMDVDDLVARLDEPISTSAPSPGELAAAIAEARGRGEVLVLTVGAGFSSTHDAAVLAARLVGVPPGPSPGVAATPGAVSPGPVPRPGRAPEGDAALGPGADAGTARAGGPGSGVTGGTAPQGEPGPDGRPTDDRGVAVVDTGTAAGAQALVVLAAAEAAAAGDDLAAVKAVAERVAGRVRLVATVADLERLAASGRVPEAARWVGDRLGVRPLFELRGGRVRPLRPAFSAEAAYQRIVARCAEDAVPGGRLHLIVLHALDPAAAARLVELTAPLAPATCVVGGFGPVMVAHTGRGLAGLAWWWDG
ncbi:MAG TPA: DegV family protein [Acidimicrobiales bacterium]|nr:DegV family protein [Acidimicrobiales bacterium]